MPANSPILLDACVLANFKVCDLLLRLAETPRQFHPRWSKLILEEVRRTHLEKLSWPERVAETWQREVSRAFPDSCVENYEHLVATLTNHEKDRHVLAAAIQGGIPTIVTFNLRDFPEQSLIEWNIEAVHPQDFLLTLYAANPDEILARLHAISRDRDSNFQRTLSALRNSLPSFAAKILADTGDTPESED